MRGIYKNIKTDIVENIIKEFEFENKMPTNGEIYTLEELRKKKSNFEIADFVGFAYLIYQNKIVTNSKSWLFCDSFKIGDNYIISIDSLLKLFNEDIKVCWIQTRNI